MGVGGQRHALGVLPAAKTRYPLYRRLGGPQKELIKAKKSLRQNNRDSSQVRPEQVLTVFELRQSALIPGHEVASWAKVNTDLPRMCSLMAWFVGAVYGCLQF